MQNKTKYSRPAIRTVDVRPHLTLLAGSPVSSSSYSLTDYGDGDANNTTEPKDAQGAVIWQDN